MPDDEQGEQAADRPITIDQFHAVDIRVGRVTAAERNPKAKPPALVLTIDLGPELGLRTSSARITEAYTPESLIGRFILAVVNLPPRRVANIDSGCLVLGALTTHRDDQGERKGDGPVVLIGPDKHDRIHPGDRIA
jgi:tRNA-binding protein